MRINQESKQYLMLLMAMTLGGVNGVIPPISPHAPVPTCQVDNRCTPALIVSNPESIIIFLAVIGMTIAMTLSIVAFFECRDRCRREEARPAPAIENGYNAV